MSQKQKNDKTKRATGLGRRTRQEIIEKWDQTDSPEIPDRVETSEIPRPPFGSWIKIEIMLFNRVNKSTVVGS